MSVDSTTVPKTKPMTKLYLDPIVKFFDNSKGQHANTPYFIKFTIEFQSVLSVYSSSVFRSVQKYPSPIIKDYRISIITYHFWH